VDFAEYFKLHLICHSFIIVGFVSFNITGHLTISSHHLKIPSHLMICSRTWHILKLLVIWWSVHIILAFLVIWWSLHTHDTCTEYCLLYFLDIILNCIHYKWVILNMVCDILLGIGEGTNVKISKWVIRLDNRMFRFCNWSVLPWTVLHCYSVTLHLVGCP